MSKNLELLFSIDCSNVLGEGVQWHAGSQTLWWTDIMSSQLFCYYWEEQRLVQWSTPERLTAFGIMSVSPVKLLVSFASGFALYQPEDQRLTWLARPELDQPGNRFNDGRVDRQGRFWSGTMVEEDNGQKGSLYRLDNQGAVATITDLRIPNALCWSPDGKRLYHADSPSGEIRWYQYDVHAGTVGDGHLFARVPRGNPDGAIIDAQGYLLCALWGGNAVARYSPDGNLEALLDLPVSQPTCVALGGPEMNVLFVTTATAGMTEVQREQEPLAGSLLVYASPYHGIPEAAPLSQWLLNVAALR
ncbi:MAG: SMP-30/gluconolactonase/LRE family protein [Natronospirillum sp.]